MRRARFIPLLLLLLGAPRVAAQQWQATGDVGIASIDQPGIPQSSAQMFGASVDAFGSRAAFRGSGLATRTSTERWTGQASAIAAFLGPSSRRVRWDLSGVMSVFAETNAQTASSAELVGRLSVGSPLREGVSLSAGGGTRRADAGRQPVGRVSLSGWASVQRERFGLELSGIRTSTTPIRSASHIALWYSDLSANWRHDHGVFSIGAVGGVRSSNSELIPNGTWGTIDAAVWIASHVSLAAAAGRSAQDVVRGVPRTTYASIALRFTTRPRVTPPRPRPIGSRPQLLAMRDRVEVRVEGASSVEVMADFTEWAPVALVRSGNVWRLDRAVVPGLHRLTIRIDGGAWTTPTNLPTATDDLGGVVALVTVP